MHAAVARTLWQSVTIRASNEYALHRVAAADLPVSCLQLVRKLHFQSQIHYNTWKRCPHELDNEKHLSRFNRLSKRAESLLGRLEDGQLRGFRYIIVLCTDLVYLEVADVLIQLGSGNMCPPHHPWTEWNRAT
jgi:hypothetical protein